jgi:hypothetical protein
MDNLMTFLDGYFQDAIIAARKHLDQEVPVVLFSWTFSFDYWSQNHFPEDTYGKVMWDTHLYYPTMDTVQEALDSYDTELPKVMAFSQKQSQDVFIGEFTLSNLGID